MSEMKRLKENIDYEDIWNKLKTLLNNFEMQTDAEKQVSEKQLYLAVLRFMYVLEITGDIYE